jgi:hypothetical protein
MTTRPRFKARARITTLYKTPMGGTGLRAAIVTNPQIREGGDLIEVAWLEDSQIIRDTVLGHPDYTQPERNCLPKTREGWALTAWKAIEKALDERGLNGG